jgi:hypothetical protein
MNPMPRSEAEWRVFFAHHDALMVPESVGRTGETGQPAALFTVTPV